GDGGRMAEGQAGRAHPLQHIPADPAGRGPVRPHARRTRHSGDRAETGRIGDAVILTANGATKRSRNPYAQMRRTYSPASRGGLYVRLPFGEVRRDDAAVAPGGDRVTGCAR